MRRARITFKGAFHHAMNRGYEGRPIFKDDHDKKFFIDLMDGQSRNLRIRILAYCLMQNHYHLVLENTSERMADFFKQINGQYGSYFRRKYRGRGYVFQDRFKSQIIQDDSYLVVAIAYVLNNPLRACLVNEITDYPWSSYHEYFSNKDTSVTDNVFVEGLFETKNNLNSITENLNMNKLPTTNTRMGKIVGGEEFTFELLKKSDRRKNFGQTLESKRIDDLQFVSVDQVYYEFKKIYEVSPDEINLKTLEGKRLRSMLLVLLRDQAGMKYTEIAKLPEFSDIKVFSFGAIYRNGKKRLKKSE